MSATSFGKLNITNVCDTPVEFEYMGEDGVTNTGFYVSVLGQYSKRVQDFILQLENKDRMREFESRKRGKGETFKKAEQDMSDTIEAVAVRVVGWRGKVLGQEVPEYSEENAIELIKVNPIIRTKVIEISNDIGNFTSSK